MTLFISSKTQATLHGVYAIEITPPTVIQGLGTGVCAFVGQFPWGPDDRVIEAGGMAELKLLVAPPGMTRIGSGYLSMIAKSFPELRAVRVLGSAAATATSTLVFDTTVDVNVATVTAKYKGVPGNSLVSTVADASDGDANHYNLTVSITGASGTTEDFLQNVNHSGVGTDTVFASLPQADRDRLFLVGNLVKLASGRPTNGTYAFTGGLDGTIDAGRYVGTAGSGDRGIALLEGSRDINQVFSDDPGNTLRAAVNAGLIAHATLMGDREVHLNGDSGQTADAARIDVASFRSVLARYADPWVYIYDDVTGAEHLVPPAAFSASLRANLSPSTAIAWKSDEAQTLLGGIVRLEAARGLQAAGNNAAGICTLIREESGGHTFEADVVTIAPISPAKRNGTRTSMLLYLARSTLAAWRPLVDAPSVDVNRDDLRISLDTFMDGLRRAQYRDPNHEPHVIQYLLPPLNSINTLADYAAGDVLVPLDVQTSAGMERIFLGLRIGPTPIVTVTV